MTDEDRRFLKGLYEHHPGSPRNKQTPAGCDGCGAVETTVLRKGGSLYCDVCAGQMASYEYDAYIEEAIRILEAWRIRRKLTEAQMVDHVEHALTLSSEEL